MGLAAMERFWSDRLGFPVSQLRAGDRVVSTGTRAEAVLLQRHDGIVIAVPEARVAGARERLAEAGTAALCGNDLARLLDTPDAPVVGPAVQLVYDVTGAERPDPAHRVESLGADDRRLEVLAEEEPEGWRSSGLARTDSPQFAILDEDRVVAVAHYTLWAEDVASIGVLVRSSHRGRGHGALVVAAASLHATSLGHTACYQTLVANASAVRVALRTGFAEFARTYRIKLAD